jgi:hypothetical protein
VSTQTVYKYRLPVDDGPLPLALPEGAQILHAEMALRDDYSLSEHVIEVWALVDPAVGPEQRWFTVRGTGHPVPPDARHVASMRDGVFVWHLFEVTP